MLSLSRRATGAWCTWGSAVSPSSAWRSLPGSTTASSAPTGPGSGSPTSTGCGTSSSSSPHTAPSCSSPTVMSSTTCHTRLQYSSKYSTALQQHLQQTFQCQITKMFGKSVGLDGGWWGVCERSMSEFRQKFMFSLTFKYLHKFKKHF